MTNPPIRDSQAFATFSYAPFILSGLIIGVELAGV